MESEIVDATLEESSATSSSADEDGTDELDEPTPLHQSRLPAPPPATPAVARAPPAGRPRSTAAARLLGDDLDFELL